MKTAELKGMALDWALAKVLGAQIAHTDPAVCLWLIKEYRANIDHTEHAPQIEVSIWYALTDEADPDFDCQSVIGDTVEQAVARCVVQMRLGDEVEVPSELTS